AATAHVDAGGLDSAQDLLDIAERGPLTDSQRARVDLVRAQVAYIANRGSDAPPLLLKAARRLEPIDAALSRTTYLDALTSAMFASRLAVGASVLEVADMAALAPKPPGCSGLTDLLLEGLTARYTTGYAASLPFLRKALRAFDEGTPPDEQLK